MTKVRFYDQAEDHKLRFAVIVTKTDGHWVFCKHKERNTLEVPGGHRESGENICIDGGMTKLMIYHGEHGWEYRDLTAE